MQSSIYSAEVRGKVSQYFGAEGRHEGGELLCRQILQEVEICNSLFL